MFPIQEEFPFQMENFVNVVLQNLKNSIVFATIIAKLNSVIKRIFTICCNFCMLLPHQEEHYFQNMRIAEYVSNSRRVSF